MQGRAIKPSLHRGTTIWFAVTFCCVKLTRFTGKPKQNFGCDLLQTSLLMQTRPAHRHEKNTRTHAHAHTGLLVLLRLAGSSDYFTTPTRLLDRNRMQASQRLKKKRQRKENTRNLVCVHDSERWIKAVGAESTVAAQRMEVWSPFSVSI